MTPPRKKNQTVCSSLQRLPSAFQLLKKQVVFLHPLYTASCRTAGGKRLFRDVWVDRCFHCLPCFPDSCSLWWLFGSAHCCAACGEAVCVPESWRSWALSCEERPLCDGISLWASRSLINENRIRIKKVEPLSAMWQRCDQSPVALTGFHRVHQMIAMFAYGNHWGVLRVRHKNASLYFRSSPAQFFHCARQQ